MRIHLKPYFAVPGSDDALILSRTGSKLTINGDSLDLSVLSDGDEVQSAHDLHPYLRDSITHTDGHPNVVLRLPIHGRAGHVDDPDPIIDPPDGPISIPDLSAQGDE